MADALASGINVFADVGAFRCAVEQGLALARHAERVIGARDRWHMAAPVSLADVRPGA